ncbi:MAG: riboflavin synthase [Elainellaceae cyanobacterium]
MFTGLIQTLGKSQPWGDNQVRVSWADASHDLLYADLALGDSVAVDGICLTVTEILTDGFIAAVSPETQDRTTLGRSPQASVVNLEGSLRVGSKLGGHFVTGHIDGVGYLQSSVRTENAWEMSFTVPDSRVSRYIVPKGSVAINGISLTVADCNVVGSWFKVAVIPLTYAETNLQYLSPGDLVNLEGDVLGKYVEKFLRLDRHPSDASQENGSSTHQHDRALRDWQETITPAESSVTAEFLSEHGY